MARVPASPFIFLRPSFNKIKGRRGNLQFFEIFFLNLKKKIARVFNLQTLDDYI